jgi:hypothetical protein
MTELLEKDKQFEWTPACEASFPRVEEATNNRASTGDARYAISPLSKDGQS